MVITIMEKVRTGPMRFSDENILSGDKIQVQDEVIGYLKKTSLGKQ